MAVATVEVHAFRCLREARLALHPRLNLVVGQNASGKTSLLEALFFLGRGRSFRTSHASPLIQWQQDAFRVVARLTPEAGGHRLGVEYSRQGFRVRVDGEDRRRLTDLASYLPVSVVDAEVHALVQGPPGNRRRFLDWGVFHVEPAFLENWRRYQRLLRQRNALLRARSQGGLTAWTAELASAGELLTAARESYVAKLKPGIQAVGERLLQAQLECRYRPGWDRQRSLEDALQASETRDRQQGGTQLGPHRAELELLVNGQPARETVSRGQQKALAAALLLAQLRLYCEVRGRGALLLLDDPAAELDEHFLGRLLAEALSLPAQLVITGLQEQGLPLDREHHRFHVEQGFARSG